MNWVPVESVVGFCDHVLGYSTEKPFEVHVLSHKLKPASGVGVGVSVGEGDGVEDGAAVAQGCVESIVSGRFNDAALGRLCRMWSLRPWQQHFTLAEVDVLFGKDKGEQAKRWQECRARLTSVGVAVVKR